MPTVLFILFPVLHHLTLPVPLHSCCSINTNSYMLPSSWSVVLVDQNSTLECVSFSARRETGQVNLYSSEGCSSLGRDVKHVRVFEEGPQQGNEGERRVKDRQKERGTRVVRISFFVPLSLSIAPPQHREDGKKKAK